MCSKVNTHFCKPKKFCFRKAHNFDTSVLFMGHVLSARGISADPRKVREVWDWPILINVKEVNSFLRLVSYHWRFIHKFAQMAYCLHEVVGLTSIKQRKPKVKRRMEKQLLNQKLTKKKIFEWMPEHQQVFNVLKEALVTPPVLGYPDFNREFMLETNASLQGLGAVLPQQDESGKLHVIAYTSQSFHPSERSICNYSSAKLELLVLKGAVTVKSHDNLLGSKFHVYTDNKSSGLHQREYARHITNPVVK